MSSWMDRREPVMSADEPIDRPIEAVGFMQEARSRRRRAGPMLWLAAAASFALLLGLSLAFAMNERETSAFRMGQVVGTFFWPLLAVGVARLLNQSRSQRSLVLVFVIACLVLAAATATTTAYRRGGLQRLLHKEALTAEDLLAQVRRCARAGDLECEEASWRDYIALRPGDAKGFANLGMVLNRRDHHAQAVEQFKQALALGEGTYDLFAYHADSLAKLGQTEQAIEWSYKSLSVVPRLVDVRGKLAQLLVSSQRPYEALALLQAYDSQLEARGQPAYFTGQRIAIETAIEQSAPEARAERRTLRLPTYAGHFFAPVMLGRSRSTPFMVDTGATRTIVSESLLKESQARYRVTEPDAQMVTADGRKVSAQAITIESMSIGWFQLRNVLAITCQDCAPLLGQSTLSGFDMQSSKTGGVESLLLVERR
ncbi:retroviral-like aspartic protease family protein [Sphaerotilaceae bacterium SBD11-9]